MRRHMASNPTIRYHGNLSLPTPVALFMLCAAGCQSADPPGAPDPGGCDGGFLSASLHGAISATIDWRDAALTCAGMPRPDDGGARLRFAGSLSDADGERMVAIILGIDDVTRTETGRELPTNVTLIEEGAGRFFGTRDQAGCWTDLDYQDARGNGSGARHAIGGTVYCVSPLAELNGGSSISFTELEFSGVIDWEPHE
jgi:hypothetical protein